jgi:hypothetical protein
MVENLSRGYHLHVALFFFTIIESILMVENLSRGYHLHVALFFKNKLVQQGLLTLPEHLSSCPVHVARSLVLCRSLFVILFFFFYEFWLPLWYLLTFGHCVVCSSSIYRFWLPLWYLLTFGHCFVCSSSIYRFWLPLWYLQTLHKTMQ